MPIKRDAVYTPSAGEVLIIQGSVGPRTTQWAYKMTDSGVWVPKGQWTMQLEGQIIGADFSDGTDRRIANQKQSIDRMLDHLRAHCPQMLGTGKCEHIGATEEKL